MSEKRFSTRAAAVVSMLGGVFFVAVLALLVLGKAVLPSAYRNAALAHNGVLLLAALAGLGLCAWLRRPLSRLPLGRKRSGWGLAVYFALLLAVQLMVTRNVWFYAGWDVGHVYQDAELLARGQAVAPDYYRVCPNNAPLTVLLSLPLWAAVKLGLAVPYGVLPYLSACMVNLACLLCVLCVRRITRSRAAYWLSLALCGGWIALSIIATVPYTDAFAIVFPILALYLYLTELKPFSKWLMISLVSFFGASIKPTVLIVLLAMVLLAALRALPWHRLKAADWKRAAAIGLALVLGAIPGRLWQDAATRQLAGSAKPEEQLSMTHYLMLGMNSQSYGGHSGDDVNYSESFATLAERQSANLRRAGERVAERGVVGNLSFFAVKAYKAFNDGSFAGSTSYLTEEMPHRDGAFGYFLRTLYDTDQPNYHTLCTVWQGVWLMVLALCAFAMLRPACRRRPETALLALILLGAAGYLLLFEVWPRYLYIFAPIFVVQAAQGMEGI